MSRRSQPPPTSVLAGTASARAEAAAEASTASATKSKAVLTLSGSTNKTLLGNEYFPRNHLPHYLSSSRSNKNSDFYEHKNNVKVDGIANDLNGGGGVGGAGAGDGDGVSLSASSINMVGGTANDGANDKGTGEGMSTSTSEAVINRVQSLKSLLTGSTSIFTGKSQNVSPIILGSMAAGAGGYGARLDGGPISSMAGSPQSPKPSQPQSASPSRRRGGNNFSAEKSLSLNQGGHLSSSSLIGTGAALHQSPPRTTTNKSTGDVPIGPAPATDDGYNDENSPLSVTPTWRLKERMKTVGVGLILALNIGTDPPDVNKPNPCAKLQCWMDPTSTSRAKAREKIGQLLETQYAAWQERAKLNYKRALDPTLDDVRNLCFTLRRSARKDRVLLHYNGHGVPRPTMNGEIWVFDMNHTQYIPLAVGDLKKWIGKPSLVVLDCSAAGALLPFFISNNVPASAAPVVGTDNLNGSNHGATMGSGIGYGFGDTMGNTQAHANAVPTYTGPQSRLHRNDSSGLDISQHTPSMPHVDSTNSVSSFNLQASSSTIKPNATDESEEAIRSVQDVMVLCPTSASETLPLNPELPADLFTSCLTTPIPIALRWFVYQNPLSCSNLPAENVDLIPGELPDRKTPLGELNWIFTAITDTIAWSVLPSPLFQRLFRQDLLVASMFRNFLLADRILRDLNCTPVSYPVLPSTCDHPLWQAWDLAVETCLSCLMRDGVLGVLRDATGMGDGGIGEGQTRPVSHYTAVEKEQEEDDKDDNRSSENVANKNNGAALRGANGARSNGEQGGGMASGGNKEASTNHAGRNVPTNTSSTPPPSTERRPATAPREGASA